MLLFILVLMLNTGLIIFGISRFKKNDLYQGLMILICLILVPSIMVKSKLFETHMLPAAPLFILALNIVAFYFAFGKLGLKLSTLPIWWLAIFQSFRLPLEFVLHQWSQSGTVPVEMTWSGQNFDVITGATSLLFFISFFRQTVFFWIFNILGFGLLINVVRVAIMSAPFPFSWNLEKPLLLLFYLPYTFIISICVWSALVGHLLLTRALLNKNVYRQSLG